LSEEGKINCTQNESQVFFLNKNIIYGCINRKDLLNEGLIYFLFSLVVVLNVILIYYAITYSYLIRTEFTIILLLASFAASIVLFYLLTLQLRVLKSIRGDSLSDELIICDGEDGYIWLCEILERISLGEIDEVAILLTQGRVGILKITIIALLILISGMISIMFIINGAYMSPLLYVSGIIFVFLAKYLVKLISSFIRLRFFESNNKGIDSGVVEGE